jgi:RHS repeat-associated protein
MQTATSQTTGVRSYSWDARDRLTAIPGVASFGYDAFGRRDTATRGGTATSFLYDRWDVAQEQQGGAPHADLLIGLGVDERFARGGATFLTDALGSPVALADSTGAITTCYGYDACGTATSSGAANDNPYQFTGRENDGTGLHYYRARYYSPAWARFVSEDPIGLAGGINSYAYGLGNPVSFADPYGLDVFICRQPAFGWMPVDHQWLKTDTIEAGMGGTCGNEPGNQYGDSPYDPVQIVDHAGRSKQPGASCKKVEGVDEKAVNDQLQIGQQLGRFTPWNQCQSFVNQVLEKARIPRPIK